MGVGRHTHSGAEQCESGSLKNLLAHGGVVAPHTGQPFSEPMLFGLGGGVGAAYFTWDMHRQHLIYVGTRFHTKETARPEFLETMCERIGVRPAVVHSSSARAAETNLKKALALGPAIVWGDRTRLPYCPPAGPVNTYHTFVVYAFDEERNEVHIGDAPARLLVITPEQLAAARQSIWTPRYRLMRVEAPARPADLPAAVTAAIKAFCAQMTGGLGIRNFGLPALQKWADALTDPRDPRGWPRFFPPGPGLGRTLLSVFEQIEIRDRSGRALRELYADFLDEAADVVDRPRLREVAKRFRESARLWSALGAALLPDSVPVLREARRLDLERKAAFVAKGAAGATVSTLQRRFATVITKVTSQPLLDKTRATALFSEARERVLRIHAGETEAVEALQRLID